MRQTIGGSTACVWESASEQSLWAAALYFRIHVVQVVTGISV